MYKRFEDFLLEASVSKLAALFVAVILIGVGSGFAVSTAEASARTTHTRLSVTFCDIYPDFCML